MYEQYIAPMKPQIRRIGTIKTDVVESSPFVLNDHLYRMEYFRENKHNPRNDSDITYMKVFDVLTNENIATLAPNHHLGSAFSDGEAAYISATFQSGNPEYQWGGNRVDIYRSLDAKNWEEWGGITFEEGYCCFNTSMCKKDDTYILAVEVSYFVDGGKRWGVRFAKSPDMKNWELLPREYCFEAPATGAQAIYSVPDDPYYYMFEMISNYGPVYTTNLVRSKDLKNWEQSPVNPILIHDDKLDKQIANPFLTEKEQERIKNAKDNNNSDLELCEFRGRTIIYYSWGNQKGEEFLAEASYEGPLKEFLQGSFPKE